MTKYEILHSGTWWKDYHANRRRQRELKESRRAAAPPPNLVLDFQPQQPIITFIPGRATPVYSRLAADGSLIPLPSIPHAGPAQPPLPYHPTTATHPLPASKVVARFQKKVALKRDSDAELLTRLALSCAKSDRNLHAHQKARAQKQAQLQKKKM